MPGIIGLEQRHSTFDFFFRNLANHVLRKMTLKLAVRTLGDFGGKLAKKKKNVAQSKLRTTTYAEVLACNRSDFGRYEFSNVRGADSQGNV